MGTPVARFRSLPLLVSSFRQQHWRGIFWLAAAIYLVVVFAIAFPFAYFAHHGSPRGLFQALRVIHLGVAFILPAVLAGRLVDDATSGTLHLMQVAGISARAWVRFRLLVIAVGYASIWVLRVPFYAFLLDGGGATVAHLFWAELLNTFLAISAAQVSLRAARRVELPSQAMGGAVFLFFLNMALTVPTGALLFAKQVWLWRPPPTLSLVAESLKSLSMFSYLKDVPTTIEGRLAALGASILHVIVGLAAGAWICRILYVDSDSEVRAARNTARSTGSAVGLRRPSHRVWSNPFFWQASEYHFAEPSARRSMVLLFAVTLPVVIAVATRKETASVLLGIWAIFACVTPEMLPSVCTGRELKDQTLSSLATLPCGGQAIYHGWKRFGDRYRLAAWIGTCVCLSVLTWRDPFLAVAWAAVTVASVWGYPPLAVVETLRSQERSGRRIVSQTAVGAIGGPLASVLALRFTHGILILAGTAALAACVYRPRALRQMDDLFVEASAR